MGWHKRKFAPATTPSPLHRPLPPAPPVPKPDPRAKPLLFASTAETNPAGAPLDEPENSPGFFRHLHTPRVLWGQNFTLRQVVFGLFLVFCLTPWP